MKHAFLISYDYPPIGSPGAMRVSNLARHLAQFGWKVTVFTPTNGFSVAGFGLEYLAEIKGVEVVRSRELRPPAKQIKSLSVSGSRGGVMKGLSRLARQVIFPDRTIGWYPAAVRSILKHARQSKPDLIYSTYPEITNHFIANRVARKLSVPWVMEYRDPWSIRSEPGWNHTNIKSPFWRTKLERHFESKFFSRANKVIVVTESMAEDYGELYDSEKIEVIFNGYDSSCYNDTSPKLGDKFTMTHAGSLYGGSRDATPVLQALRQLVESNEWDRSDICLKLVGGREEHVESVVKDFGISDLVESIGRLSYQETAKVLCCSHVNLVVDGGIGNLPTKLFDYAGSRRPIFALCRPQSEVARFVQNHNLGIVVDQNSDTVAQGLRECRQLSASYVADTKAVGFTRKATAEKIASLFSEVLSSVQS